jgi:outer membrane immunogenic protein
VSSILALGAGGAMAADLTPQPAAAPAGFNWTGFYIGVHGGLAAGDSKFNVSSDIPFFNDDYKFNDRGGFGGAQVGYNYQFATNWVAGVEADISAGDISSSGTSDLGIITVDRESKVDWSGTIRGRLGFAWDNALFYGTGGGAYGHVKSSETINIFGTPIDGYDADRTQWGWTAGAGVEYGLTQNITFKAEYLYVDLGSSTLGSNPDTSVDVETRFHSLDVGLNAKF